MNNDNGKNYYLCNYVTFHFHYFTLQKYFTFTCFELPMER